MINIFEELKEIGFENLDKVDLFPPKQEPSEKEREMNKKKISIEEVLYDKSYICPVCTKEFKAKAIRSGKNRLLTTDLDLKANYDVVNPLLYECIVCENCGYAALSKNFNMLTTSQIRWIKEQICTRYKPHHYPPILTEKDGVLRYKLVLLNSYVKKAKDGEKGYIILAHFKKNSIEVEVGEKITEGQFIGLVGNSGTTSEPHLHFQCQKENPFDMIIPTCATGIPIQIKGIEQNMP